MKLKQISMLIISITTLAACNNNGESITQTNSQPTLSGSKSSVQNTTGDLVTNVSDINPQDWKHDWQDKISKLSAEDQTRLDEIQYYVRAAKVNLDNIYPGSAQNPDNVQRIERILPKTNFEKAFPLVINPNKVHEYYPSQIWWGDFSGPVNCILKI